MTSFAELMRERYLLRKKEIQALKVAYMAGLPAEWKVEVSFLDNASVVLLRLNRKLLRGSDTGSFGSVGVEVNVFYSVELDQQLPVTKESFIAFVRQAVSGLPASVEEYINEMKKDLRAFHTKLE